jgi:hypothetical protein
MDFIPLFAFSDHTWFTEPYNGFGWVDAFPYPLFIFGIIGIVGVAKLVQILVRKSKKKQTV